MSDVLLLNSTYEPLHVIHLQRAVRLVFQRKAEVVHAVADRAMRAATCEIPMPSVVRLLYYVATGKRRKKVALTKKNVLLRDDHTCAYCARKGGSAMTVDHVVPRAQGGRSTWDNLVASCETCNSRKRDRTPKEAGMPLRVRPREPKFIPWLVIRRNTAPEEWGKYFLWSVSIEDRPPE